MRIRTQLRKLLRAATGYDISKVQPGPSPLAKVQPSPSPFIDIRGHLQTTNPTLFDVGANCGQTIDAMLAHFPGASIHAFEPGRAAFDKAVAGRL
jgi:hypothetical protein